MAKKKDFNIRAIDNLITDVEEMDNLVDQEPPKAKQKPKGNGGVVFSTRLDEEVVKKLKGYAFYNGITLKEALETIITNYLEGKTIAHMKED